MIAHTPGPWHVAPESKLCIDAPDGNVAIVNLARASEADARLIAAAPELLAALKFMLEAWPYGHTNDKTKAVVDARAAIAKATA